MAKTTIDTGAADQAVHTRTTGSGTAESQVAVIGIDGSDSVVPASSYGLLVDEADPGTWGYKAGTSGTPALTGKRVLAISCIAGGSGATITINGGDTISVPAGAPFSVALRGRVTAPTVVFTGTSAYFVETAT